MAVVDPQSTTFQRSEAWRIATQKRQLRWRQQWVPYERDLRQPQARRDRLARTPASPTTTASTGTRSRRPGSATPRPRQRRARNERAPAARRAGRRRGRARRRRSSAARPSRSSWPRTCCSRRRAHACCARARSSCSPARWKHMLSKQRILEIYLNSVEWGEGVFGAEAAARHYFRISARDALRPAGGAAGGACCRRPSASRSAPARPTSSAAPRPSSARMGSVELPR